MLTLIDAHSKIFLPLVLISSAFPVLLSPPYTTLLLMIDLNFQNVCV